MKRAISKILRKLLRKYVDNYYEPNEIVVKEGETIKFIVKNMGELVHELNIATKEMHIKHQPEMAKMVEHEILLADRIDKKKMKKWQKWITLWHTNMLIVFYLNQKKLEK